MSFLADFWPSFLLFTHPSPAMYPFFRSEFFDFESTRTLGTAPFGGCESGEFLEASERVEEIAKSAEQNGNKSEARRLSLRLSNYLRASAYMLPTEDKRVLECVERSIQSLRCATSWMESKVVVMDISYEDGKTLPGYLYLPPVSKRLRGGDETPIEAVLRYILDHLSSIAQRNPDYALDLNRVAVAGVTMGGYYALRAATDSRIRVCVSVDPFHSRWTLALTRMPQWYAKFYGRAGG
ncbi:MAG: hypothetical protein Q9213_002170 [Squamulea squamosa]